jgi:tRNA(Ile)-lysidine synthase
VLLSPDQVFSHLELPVGARQLLVGYSGGLDSHVLLHLLARHTYPHLPGVRVMAIHVNHGLNRDADKWADHCRNVCNSLGTAFHLIELDARAPQGESQEAWARQLRYKAIGRVVGVDDVLFTAHHQDDMAETLLIQLFRGAGPAGLAAMPTQARFGKGWHYRPLLACPRADLLRYARAFDLAWIEDDSNQDSKYDRNLIRHTILPGIRQRWPGITQTLYRASRHQADASHLLDNLADIDLKSCQSGSGNHLSVSQLLGMSRPRAANTLRRWIRSQGFQIPNERQLVQIFSGALGARPNATPCVSWSGAELRRYRDKLFITAPLPPPDPDLVLDWDLNRPCKLLLGSVYAVRTRGEGIRSSKCGNDRLRIRFRKGNEMLSLSGHRHSLRKLFQQHAIPSCFRDHMPLLYIGDTLVGIPGIAIADEYRARGEEDGWKIIWTESETIHPDSTNGPDR